MTSRYQRHTERMLRGFIINQSGITVIELLVALGIMAIISVGITSLFISSLRGSRVVGDQLDAQHDGRRAVLDIVNEVRRADTSSIGSYPVAVATTNTLTFYSNIDVDNYREQIRYFLQGTILKKGVTKPSGSPLQYATSSEVITEIAHDVVNAAWRVPVFTYYNQAYTGTEAALPATPSTTDIHVVRVQLEIERDPRKIPVPLHVESITTIRSLKSN